MVVWVVKIFNYGTGDIDVYGIYSNLALAGRAAVNSLANLPVPTTFIRFEEPWGYVFLVQEIDGGTWDYQEIEIGRVTVNE